MNYGRQFWQALTAVALGALISSSALAQSVTTRLVVAGGAATSTKIVPGGSTAMDVRLDIVGANIFGTGFTITQTAPALSGFLSITGRSFAGSPFSDTTSGTADAIVLAPASALLDPANNDNLGRTTIGFVGIAPASDVLAANLTFTASASTPLGTYSIKPTPGVSFATDATPPDFLDYDMSTATPFTIVVGQTLTVTKSGIGTGTVTADSGAINCGATCADIYPGTVVTLTATPAGGSSFAGWSGGGCSGTGTCVVTVDAAKTVNAQFDPVVVTFGLSVTRSGTGSGTVTSEPVGINCGATCSANFNSGTLVTLTPAPAAGSVFAGWGGACSGVGSCVVTMDAARSVSAAFNLQTFVLTVNRAGTGTGTVTSNVGAINCGATCSDTYNAGTVVTLTATPTTGVFAGWSGGGCSGTGTCVVTLNAATTVTATFAPTFSVTITKVGSGTGTVTSNPGAINCGVTCTDTFAQNAVVTLTAAPAAGSVFAGWSGAGCSGTGTCVVTVTAATTVTATFTAQWVLTVARTGAGTGTVTSNVGGINCGATCSSSPLNDGTVVTLTAVPAAGSVFAGWSGGSCSGTGTCAVTLTAATTVTATFAPTFTVTITKVGSGTGTVTSNPGAINCGVTCTDTFAQNAVVTLTAAPAAGSVFSGWSGAGCSGTGTCVVTVTAATTVTATFTAQWVLTVARTGAGTGTVTSNVGGINCGATCSSSPLNDGTVVTLTATPAAGSVFSGWSGGGCSGTGTCVVTLNAATTVTATFAPTFTVTITKVGSGTGAVTSNPGAINCGVTCTDTFAQNAVVTLTATPAAGSVFSGWSGGGCSGTGTCVVTVTAATTVTATFTAQWVLTVARTGTGTGTVTSNVGGINCGATCSSSPLNDGTVVTLTAVPAAGSVFAGWSGGGCSGTGTCVVTLNAATTVTATFAPTFTVTITKVGSGTGTVTSNPGAINCGVTCTDTFAQNAVVTLTATPAAGSVFSGWSGAGCSGTGTCVVTVTAATTVTATFTAQWVLTVARTGAGTGTVTSNVGGINCGATCSSSPLNDGTVVTLTAVPAAGSVFAGWSGGGCSGTDTCAVTLTAATTVTATFTAQWVLTVARTGTGTGAVTSNVGGIDCGATCSSSPLNDGTVVTLTATPAAGSAFAGWSGGGCSGTGTCAVTVTAATTVTATFTAQWVLTVARSGTGTGTVTSNVGGINCGATCSSSPLNDGTVVTLTAVPAAGSVFAGWSGAGCSGTGTCAVALTATTTVTATFNTGLTLTVVKAGNGTGTVTSNVGGINCGATCSASYASGTVVTLTAAPGSGQDFTGWSGGACSGIGTCVVTLNAPTTVTATFTETTPPPAMPDLNQHGLTGSWYESATSGQGVEVEIFPDPSSGTGSTFVSWFTYDPVIGGAERQRWYTAQGPVVTGQPDASLTIYQNTGGNFNAPPITNAQPVGTATLSFDTCSSGELSYRFTDGTGRTGTIPLTRLTQNVTCSPTTPYPANADFALSGNWYDPATSGQGLTVEVNPINGAFFATWYTYAPNGAGSGVAGQRWYTAQGNFTPGMRSIPVTIYETTGGMFDTPTPPGQATVQVGTGTMAFQSCSAATFRYIFTGGTSSGLSATITLRRVGPLPPGCGT